MASKFPAPLNMESVVVHAHPLRQKSANGEPKPGTSIERTCRQCGASFIGLAPGKTGERGLWVAPWVWVCSQECADRRDGKV